MRRILSSFLLFFVFAFQALAGTTGGIRGVVSDSTTKEGIGGVTIVLTSPQLQGEIATLSDESGLYTATNLPPGVYTVSATFGGATSERKGVTVEVDKTVAINVAISVSLAGETYVITEKAPNVDVASATVGVNLSKEYIENVPTGRGRDFTNAIGAVASGGTDTFGATIGGATSPENSYVIDGLNVTDASSGRIFTHLTLDFVDQFEVKEGGYGPEFGRATGGLINVVTKGGSNEFHGSVFATYRPGWAQLAPKAVTANSAIASTTELDYYLAAGAEVGGPIVKDVLWFHLGYAPELLSEHNYQNFRYIAATAANEPMLDAYGNPIFVDSGVTNDYKDFWHTHQYTFKLTHLITNNMRHSLNVRGSPSFFNGPITLVGDPSTFLFTRKWRGNIVSGIYNFTGKFFNDKFKIDADLGVNHDQFHSAAGTDLGATLPRITISTTTGEPTKGLDILADPAQITNVPAQCSNYFADGSSPCPVNNYRKGGFGGVLDNIYTRLVEKIALTNLFDFAGLHQLKYGVDMEQTFGTQDISLTGGGTFSYNWGARNRYTSTQFSIDGKPVDALHGVTGVLNYGAFVGDSWNPIPSLVLNYGVRWEGQDYLGMKSWSEPVREHKFSVMGNIAPRAGFIWDFTREGKGAVRFNYGRFYESVPMDLLEREFPTQAVTLYRYGNSGPSPTKDPCYVGGVNADGTPKIPGDTPIVNANERIRKITNPFTQCPKGALVVSQASDDALVVPGLKGQYSDEFIASVEYEPFSSWVFGITGVYRTLGRVIEDISTDGGETFVIANPGDFRTNDLQDIKDEIATTADPKRREVLERTLGVAEKISAFPNPVRDNYQIQFKLDKKLSNNFLILATYVLSWSWGNYPGLFSANNGQLDPNITTQFDLPQLIINRMGYLQQDQRHRFKLSGFYRASMKELFDSSLPLSFKLGLSGRLESGKPYEVLGALNPLYGNSEVFILPRGSGGRLPWTWSVDMSVGATWDFSQDMSFELFAEIYNLFNQREVTAVDANYTFDFVQSVPGGTVKQLPYLLNTDGQPVNVNPNYGNATAFQDPFSAQFGARLKF